MAFFYFHLRDGDTYEEDPDGVDLPDLDAAKREALRCAREMMIEQINLGIPVSDLQTFEVTDEFNVLQFELAFRDVLHS